MKKMLFGIFGRVFGFLLIRGYDVTGNAAVGESRVILLSDLSNKVQFYEFGGDKNGRKIK